MVMTPKERIKLLFSVFATFSSFNWFSPLFKNNYPLSTNFLKTIFSRYCSTSKCTHFSKPLYFVSQYKLHSQPCLYTLWNRTHECVIPFQTKKSTLVPLQQQKNWMHEFHDLSKTHKYSRHFAFLQCQGKAPTSQASHSVLRMIYGCPSLFCNKS